jgi:glycosyltransferase involved in cell wall biosynthesis
MAAHPSNAIPLFIPEIEQLGGAERSLLAMARFLHGQGRPAHLVTYVDHCDFARFAEFPLPIDVLHPAPGGRARIAALRRYLAERSTAEPLILASGYQPALHLVLAGTRDFHCLMHDTPALFHPGSGPPPLRQRLRTAISNRIIARHRHGHFIVTSEFLRAECGRDFGIDARIARMGGMGRPGAFRRRPVGSELRLLSVCRIEPNKRVDWMLDALAALEHSATPLSARIPWRLDLAGKGSLLEVMRGRTQALGLSSRVHFHGFVPDEQLATLYDQAHAFLMPAVQGYGIPAIEALQRGIPVLLHRDSGVSDILLETPWAVVLTGGPEQMVPKLQELLGFLLSDGPLHRPPPPHLPTEASWARQVAELCGYV